MYCFDMYTDDPVVSCLAYVLRRGNEWVESTGSLFACVVCMLCDRLV